MKYVSVKLTDYILKKHIIHKEDYDVYQYGFQCFLELFVSTICSIIIAFSLNMVLECLLFFLFFIPMRSFSGGIHLNTYIACLCSSCLILLFTLLAAKYLTVSGIISFIIFVGCAIIIKLSGPVDHPNRKVDSIENQTFVKRTNLVLLLHTLIAIIFLLFNNKCLLLQAITYLFLCITSLIGKAKYRNA